ncbi:ATP-grasp domain-containing protein [Kineosporia sp. J2-2]|uniref:ATP-grasp domain-containing protein n=1 Tax=Kineosporia corallincola TaxID=2835133 RepID=A0ABS5TRB8_9ACTN|nr:ATP-grasp domain-containing protein [Kineosporia corallincola]MBT0773319.1 ATP-grasp domain-containing protein [Kineosporia corallincola]
MSHRPQYRVAVVGGRPAPIHGARDLGIDVVLVHQEGQYEESILEHVETVVHADITDGPALLRALAPLHEQRPFDRVMTTTEPAGESTGHVVDRLKLPGVSERTAHLLKDKFAMREVLAKHGLSPVRYRHVVTRQEAAGFVAEVGRSVLKPVDGVASLHIHPAATPGEAEAAWDALVAAGVTKVLAEEYLEGPVVSVDSFSFEGRHVPMGYSEYRMNERFVEWEVSTPSRVAAAQLPQLLDLTPRLLDAVGLTEGPSHSEFILTADGPRVLESHARLAGSGAPELVRRAFGADLNRMFLTVPLGIDELPSSTPEPVAGACAQFFVPPAGKLRGVEVDPLPGTVDVRHLAPGEEPRVFLPFLPELREAREAIVVQKSSGDVIPPLLTVADCVSGYVLVTGPDAGAAVARGDELVRAVHFDVEN